MGIREDFLNTKEKIQRIIEEGKLYTFLYPYFIYEDGTHIINPFRDEDGMKDVNPITYYKDYITKEYMQEVVDFVTDNY